jgi:hypothetical protein
LGYLHRTASLVFNGRTGDAFAALGCPVLRRKRAKEFGLPTPEGELDF